MIEQLVSRKDLAVFLNDCNFDDKLFLSKILFSVILPLANKQNKKVTDLNIPNNQLIESLNLLKDKKITNSHIKILIPLLNHETNVNKLIKEHELYVINSPVKIEEIIHKIIEKNNIKITQAKNISNILLGKLMKETSGQAEIAISKKVIDKIIKDFI